MLRLLVWVLLTGFILSIVSFGYEITSPSCGWGITPKPNHGFPIQYATGPVNKKIPKHINSLCAAGVLHNDSYTVSFPFEFVPGVLIFPILFVYNILFYSAISIIGIFLLQNRLLKKKRKKFLQI